MGKNSIKAVIFVSFLSFSLMFATLSLANPSTRHSKWNMADIECTLFDLELAKIEMALRVMLSLGKTDQPLAQDHPLIFETKTLFLYPTIGD